MQKSNFGVSVGVVGAAMYLLSLFGGYMAALLLIGYVLLFESNTWLKRTAVKVAVITFIFSVASGCIGHLLLGELTDSSTVFIQMVRFMFPAVISGILLSAILAAAMSTADSQLLASASAFASDVYKPIIRKDKATETEMLWAGRIVVLVIAVVALFIAANPNSGTIMGLVENAWGVFGAAFGPVILLSLFWRRMNYAGACAGIITGAVVDIPIFMPLIGFDKEEIVTIARKIGTMETSILPYEDCCTVFTPKHPKTKPTIAQLVEAEKALDRQALIERALENIEKIKVSYHDDPLL